MNQYIYNEPKSEIGKSDILGQCCNCNTNILKKVLHHTYIDYHTIGYDCLYCCPQCDVYYDALLVFCALLSFLLGTREHIKMEK
jgi:hypothetical protein